MDTRIITLSQSDIDHSKLRVSSCDLTFFPDGIIGPSNSSNGYGRQIQIEIFDYGRTIKTDIQGDKNGKSRGFLRKRIWGDYYRNCNLKAGDQLQLSRVSKMKYRLEVFSRSHNLTFIDLFAGIGGIRTAFEFAGAKCVYSSEWNRFAAQTYEANYGELPDGDITKVDEFNIPHHDILTGGFPCQPFSIAGVSKKKSLGKAHGFLDKTQGTLFFDVLRILKAKKPKAFLLENVRNLKSHDKGRTYEVIESSLVNLGYNVKSKVINGKNCVPQNRERIYIVGTDPDIEFEFPTDEELQREYRLASKISDILDKDVDEKYYLTDNLWNYLKNYKEKHRKAGNGFGYGLVGPKDTARTLSARYYKDGSEILYHPKGQDILLENPQKSKPRRLTPRECARLMGFDAPGKSEFKIPVSDMQAYKQFGNSVVVPVVKAIARKLLDVVGN